MNNFIYESRRKVIVQTLPEGIEDWSEESGTIFAYVFKLCNKILHFLSINVKFLYNCLNIRQNDNTLYINGILFLYNNNMN